MTLFEKKEKLSAALKIRNRINKLEDALSDYMRSGGLGAAVLHSDARGGQLLSPQEITGEIQAQIEKLEEEFRIKTDMRRIQKILLTVTL
jgi:hypothetical protein